LPTPPSSDDWRRAASRCGGCARRGNYDRVDEWGSLFQLVARPSIKTLQDLRGKIVGSSRIGAGTDFVLRRILDRAGLVQGKDVLLIATGLSESEKRILLMLQGKLDATLGEPDKVFQLMEMKGEKMTVLGDLRNFGIPVPGSEFVTTRDFVKDHRARLKNFLMAL
jgi:ABC-type nitrate/sulfonate/bicarbonate transport system substrate-binding protein